MRSIFSFKISKNITVFVILFVISSFITITSHVYQGSQSFSSSKAVIGFFFDLKSRISRYLYLNEYNEMLVNENFRLQQELSNIPKSIPNNFPNYNVIPGFVIKNSFVMRENYLLADKGYRDGIKPHMGVFSPKGVVGIAERVDKSYTRVLSILNDKTRISAGLKNSYTSGMITWDGKSKDYVRLRDIPKLVKVKVGDTIITSGMSFLFPRGILIGSVDRLDIYGSDNFYNIRVKLFNDMSCMGPIYFIENTDYDDLIDLEKF